MGRNNHTRIGLTIGRLAHAAGVGITTIRYYQQRGLLRQPDKPASGGFRFYNHDDLRRLLLIRQAQEYGFSLTDISDLLTHLESGDCRAVEALTEKRLKTIRGQIRLLEDQHRNLSALSAGCPHEHCDQCPLMRQLGVVGSS